jgi:tetratricopeptide (TPR) repeat protein
MTLTHLATSFLAALLWVVPAAAQQNDLSATNLLQKGIYAQQTLGDLDQAIQAYRQVLSTPSADHQVAGQAQYQLVLCMMQKGDRAAATRELDALTKNFADQPELIAAARRAVPPVSNLLPTPWPRGEASQLNIKRDGQFTGEYLYYYVVNPQNPDRPYFVSPGTPTVFEGANGEHILEFQPGRATFGQEPHIAPQVMLHSKLVTKHSTRSISRIVEAESLEPVDNPTLNTDDITGDASAFAVAGPAIDVEPLIFRMRRLPLSVGYKAKMTTRPFLMGAAPQEFELSVTASEEVQVTAGKFRCYKIALGHLGQTYWIGIDGARPLVKMQFGNFEAELVKSWDVSFYDDALSFLKKAGWNVSNFDGGSDTASVQVQTAAKSGYDRVTVQVSIKRIYTPAAQISQAIQDDLNAHISELDPARYSDIHVTPAGPKPRQAGAAQVMTALIDSKYHRVEDGMPNTSDNHSYYAFIRTENAAVEIRMFGAQPSQIGVVRFLLEPLLANVKLP